MPTNPDGWQKNPDGTWNPPVHAAVQKQWEVPPDVALTTIRDKAVEVTDANGNTVIRMGKLTDGTYGLAIFNASGQEVLRLGESGGVNQSLIVKNDAGTEIIRIGEQTDGNFAMRVNNASGTEIIRVGEQSDDRYAMRVNNASGTQVLRLGQQTTERFGLSSFDAAGNRITDYGELPASRHGLEVLNTGGVSQIRVGELAAGGYGLEAISGGTTVTLDKLSYGIQFAQVIAAESTTSTVATDLATDGPSVTITVGDSGRALVHAGAGVGLNDTGATAVVQLNRDNGAELVNFVTLVHNFGGSGTVSEARGRLFTGLSAGSHTFKLRYFTTANTATFSARWISAQPF